ncbi:hypothetical protein AX15_006960 [Amanita polypyramis BW_CC]|nr:hypothetical protein AX15_006960 [Amanita polypyramis BW_CC]
MFPTISNALQNLRKWITGLSSNYDYSILPSSHSEPEDECKHDDTGKVACLWFNNATLSFKRRSLKLMVAFAVVLLGLGYLTFYIWGVDPGPLPPTFEEWREYERQLPQNNASLPLPEGKEGKYLLIDNYSTHVGWGNLLEELIMHAFLAYSSKRALVLYEFVWDPKNENYTKFKGKYIPSRIPISVTLAGPIAGGTMGPDHADVPRAVSREYFDNICPNKFEVDTDSVERKLLQPTGNQITQAWTKKLEAVKDRCVVVPKGSEQVFNYLIYGEFRLLDVWPELSQSPILQRFAWSPLILGAYDRNRHTFEMPPLTLGRNSSLPDASSANITLPEFLDGLLVVHIRRGDFKGHCRYLQKHNTGYNAFNSFSEFHDRFEPPSEYRAKTTYYTDHCYPSIERMITKIEAVQQKQANLRRLYIMTNAKRPWLASFVDRLRQTSSWDNITTSRELNLTWEQKYASQALDALVAQRAEAFIGNGFSSLTSNINMLRMAGKFKPSSTYFW